MGGLWRIIMLYLSKSDSYLRSLARFFDGTKYCHCCSVRLKFRLRRAIDCNSVSQNSGLPRLTACLSILGCPAWFSFKRSVFKRFDIGNAANQHRTRRYRYSVAIIFGANGSMQLRKKGPLLGRRKRSTFGSMKKVHFWVEEKGPLFELPPQSILLKKGPVS